jgi:4-amino-4-deoxy-L-arabinose transferase-like glycosyltransferase
VNDSEPSDRAPRAEIAEAGQPAEGESKRRKKKKRSADDAEIVEPGVASPNAETAEPSEEDDAVETPSVDDALLPQGNPIQLRGLAPLLIGCLVAFAIMALGPQYRFGVPLGILSISVAALGALDLLGSFDDPTDRVVKFLHVRELTQPLAIFVAGLASLWAFVTLAVDGRLQIGSLPPQITAGVLIPAAFMTLVIGTYRVLEGLGVYKDDPRPMHQRHGFWLIAITTLVYLPVLGSHSLSDPWETHYGEVSREILARNDWVSLWWAQDGWFWSKPILDFWLQAIAMATFGVRFGADRMMSAALEGRMPWPEWAVRLPVFLLTIGALYLSYKAVSKTWGRRAGFLGGLVLATMPQWFLVTHQTMTDMPFVATMTMAMACVMLGLHGDAERKVPVYEVDLGFLKLRLSAFHVVLGAVVACALPQILYLLSRNLEIRLNPFDLHVHKDSFRAGSPGNCSLPTNEPCHDAMPVLRGLAPALQALIWLQATALVIYMSWGERRTSRLWFLAAWLFCALSTMAKGPAGIGLPVLAALGSLAISRRGKDILRMEAPAGMLILLAVAFPWFVAMYARHGQPFTDRLFFHDMYKRAFTHVHDTNEGDDVSFRYYVWQLGYATFPWVGLAPFGLLHWMRHKEESQKSKTAGLLVLWFTIGFALFSLMLTKFHHYILPAVAPAGLLTGIALDEMLPKAPKTATPLLPRALHIGGIGTGVALVIYGVANIATGALTHGGVVLGALALVFGVCVAVATAVLVRLDEVSEPVADSLVARHDRALFGGVAAIGGLVVLLVGRDLAAKFEGQYNQVRLLHLFTYNYKRPWPASLDFAPWLWAFTFVAAAIMALLLVAKWRRHVVTAMASLAVVFAVWGIDVYFMQASPHWGQRETVLAYYQAARTAPGPLVAYQMNWKGENFYTGNHVPAFVSTGKKFNDYILEQKKKGFKTFYFLSEHGRMESLRSELGGPRTFDKLTPPELNNKFGLVRAVFE